MKKTTMAAIAAAAIITACGSKEPAGNGQEQAVAAWQNLPGDSTLYGLACDGCTDSVLVVLPYAGGDPDTFDIIEAHQLRHIYGRPHIGDELAVFINPDDSMEALKVINLTTLSRQWAYRVVPTLRNVEQMPKRMQRRMMERIPDSLKQQLLAPKEYTLKLKRDNTAMAVGGVYRQTTTDDMSPVEYPPLKRYTEWHLWNGHLLLAAPPLSLTDSLQDVKTDIDTFDIVLLRQDTLILRQPDGTEQGYYSK